MRAASAACSTPATRSWERLPDGRLDVRTDIVFHGGDGATLEMRVFCLDDILRHLGDAGFTGIAAIDAAPDWGILYDNPCSRAILAVKA